MLIVNNTVFVFSFLTLLVALQEKLLSCKIPAVFKGLFVIFGPQIILGVYMIVHICTKCRNAMNGRQQYKSRYAPSCCKMIPTSRRFTSLCWITWIIKKYVCGTIFVIIIILQYCMY